MPAVHGPEEVYRKYLAQFGYDRDGDPHAMALFTFALVERDKFDWLEHHRVDHDGKNPPADAITQWYSSKPDSYFDEKGRWAFDWYTSFARVLLEPEIEASNQIAIQTYIGDKLRFWPQIATGLIANFLFLLILGVLSAAVLTDFSPIAWMKAHIHTP